MGQVVQIITGFVDVEMPDGKVYSAGDQVTLTDAQYAGLSPAIARTVSAISSVPDPIVASPAFAAWQSAESNLNGALDGLADTPVEPPMSAPSDS